MNLDILMMRLCISLWLIFPLLALASKDLEQASPSGSDTVFGVRPPGSTPEIFAPGIVNTQTNREIEGMFGSSMNSFYFIRRPNGTSSQSNSLMVIEYEENAWRESVVKKGVSEPSISPDGRTIYLKTRFIARTSEGWSAPNLLGAPFDDLDIMRISASSNGTYYFDTFTPKLDAPLRYSRLIDGVYEQPRSLGEQFARGSYNAHPFVAPDESYIIFDSRRNDGFGSSDLYISFRSTDGTWGPAINLGEKINTPAAENYASISPDGRFLVFDRREVSDSGAPAVDIYWVGAEVIEALRNSH
ncbi:MAG: PD40 domain-containing protein [Xanthomonadales bacterium]|nr:PD40 domain-containing protein [Xanthomonadales bacterium]